MKLRVSKLVVMNEGVVGSRYLGGQDDEEGAEEAERLSVVSLHDSYGADGVGVSPAVRHPGACEYGYDDVLLDVEGARVKGEPVAEEAIVAGGEDPGHEFADGEHRNLHEDGGYGEGLRPEYEECVEEYEEHAGAQAEHPSPEGQHRHAGVVRLRDHERHLLHRASLRVGLLHSLFSTLLLTASLLGRRH